MAEKKNNTRTLNKSDKLSEEKQLETPTPDSLTDNQTEPPTERGINTRQRTSRSNYQDGDDFKKREK